MQVHFFWNYTSIYFSEQFWKYTCIYFGKGLIITCHCIFVFSTDPLLANKLYGKLCMLPLCGNGDCGVMGVPNGGMNIGLSQ